MPLEKAKPIESDRDDKALNSIEVPLVLSLRETSASSMVKFVPSEPLPSHLPITSTTTTISVSTFQVSTSTKSSTH